MFWIFENFAKLSFNVFLHGIPWERNSQSAIHAIRFQITSNSFWIFFTMVITKLLFLSFDILSFDSYDFFPKISNSPLYHIGKQKIARKLAIAHSEIGILIEEPIGTETTHII